MKNYVFAALIAAGMLMATPAWAGETKFPEGIFVGEFSLGGMTEAEAEETVRAHIKKLESRGVRLSVDGNPVTTTARELGFYWKNQDAVKEAASHVVEGNLIQRYMGQKDLEKSPVHIGLETGVGEGEVEAFIRQECAGMMQEPQNASITRVDGAFQVTPGITGRTVDVEATRQVLDQALAGNTEEDVEAQAVVILREPDVKEEDLATIQDVLGTFSTDFSSSGASRSANLSNGASKINGHVLMPGETLSGYECMHPFTIANGYHTAAAYENGQVVDSIGGGVCQIATTLYNAALRAELEITQRQNHSMIVGYVRPSMDAAIAGTYKDIKITNNYSTPIYVEGGTSGRTLTFTIYGKETRPGNRKVEYVSETLRVVDPGAPTERVDPSMAPGARRQVQSAHRGLKSRLWKVVTVDGNETERTMLSEDTYNASKAIVLVGPPAPVQPVDPALVPGQPGAEAGGDQAGAAGGDQGQTGTPDGNQGQTGAAGGNQGQAGAIGGNQGQTGAAGGDQGQAGAAGGNQGQAGEAGGQGPSSGGGGQTGTVGPGGSWSGGPGAQGSQGGQPAGDGGADNPAPAAPADPVTPAPAAPMEADPAPAAPANPA